MNKRIQELAEQAGASVSTIGGIFINKTNLDIEKFAQLILGECTMLCGAVHSASEHVRGAGDPFGLGAAKCKSMIEGHFGIKDE